MKTVDRPVIGDFEQIPAQCLKVVSCAKVEVCPTILPLEDCRAAFWCGDGLFEAISTELVDICASEFYLACGKFGDIVGPVCPFDPVSVARFHRLAFRIGELEATVEELRGKG
ncbi:MAG: hypothetical protein SWK90_13880 [Chloroflexota bacterium]|nr:hypothetical protein [Chloroflexota bacterium]